MLSKLVKFVREPEVIGPPDCPIMHRWTLCERRRFWPFKIMLHHFLPWGDDRDPHDHPMHFVTFVLRGRYKDLHVIGYNGSEPIWRQQVMKAPTVKFRSAEHLHITKAGEEGAWTLVITGPVVRAWGFMREGKWWFWRDYEQEFGFAMRCEDLPKDYRPQDVRS